MKSQGERKEKKIDQEEMKEEEGGLSAAIHLSSLMRSESYTNTDIDNNP